MKHRVYEFVFLLLFILSAMGMWPEINAFLLSIF